MVCRGEPFPWFRIKHRVMGFDRISVSWWMKRKFDFIGNNYSTETGVEQFELHASIKGQGIGILFCNLTSLPAVLLTGRGERYYLWRRGISFQKIFSAWLEVRWETVLFLGSFCRAYWLWVSTALLWNSEKSIFALWFFFFFFFFFQLDATVLQVRYGQDPVPSNTTFTIEARESVCWQNKWSCYAWNENYWFIYLCAVLHHLQKSFL